MLRTIAEGIASDIPEGSLYYTAVFIVTECLLEWCMDRLFSALSSCILICTYGIHVH